MVTYVRVVEKYNCTANITTYLIRSISIERGNVAVRYSYGRVCVFREAGYVYTFILSVSVYYTFVSSFYVQFFYEYKVSVVLFCFSNCFSGWTDFLACLH